MLKACAFTERLQERRTKVNRKEAESVGESGSDLSWQREASLKDFQMWGWLEDDKEELLLPTDYECETL